MFLCLNYDGSQCYKIALVKKTSKVELNPIREMKVLEHCYHEVRLPSITISTQDEGTVRGYPEM